MKLYSDQASVATSSKRAALQKQLNSLKEEQEQAALLARFAEREAYRVMPIDWIGYRRYLDIQEHSKERAEALDLQCKAIEKELQSLQK